VSWSWYAFVLGLAVGGLGLAGFLFALLVIAVADDQREERQKAARLAVKRAELDARMKDAQAKLDAAYERTLPILRRHHDDPPLS
jgi:hypothetical protein